VPWSFPVCWVERQFVSHVVSRAGPDAPPPAGNGPSQTRSAEGQAHPGGRPSPVPAAVLHRRASVSPRTRASKGATLGVAPFGWCGCGGGRMGLPGSGSEIRCTRRSRPPESRSDAAGIRERSTIDAGTRGPHPGRVGGVDPGAEAHRPRAAGTDPRARAHRPRLALSSSLSIPAASAP
jgi:hypothetical protein